MAKAASNPWEKSGLPSKQCSLGPKSLHAKQDLDPFSRLAQRSRVQPCDKTDLAYRLRYQGTSMEIVRSSCIRSNLIIQPPKTPTQRIGNIPRDQYMEWKPPSEKFRRFMHLLVIILKFLTDTINF